MSIAEGSFAPIGAGDPRARFVELTGKPLDPGQAAGVRKALATMRFTGEVDPEVQPALLFDPEVDGE